MNIKKKISLLFAKDINLIFLFSLFLKNKILTFSSIILVFAIILAVAHKNFLKKISYYNKFYKDNKNKIFVDIKNKYSNYDLLNNGYKYFQL